MILKRYTAMFLATGGYIGKIPFAPGTFGSLVGLPIVFAFSKISLPAAMLITLGIIFVGVWAAHHAEQQLGAKDPGCIVIDEIAGMCVTLIGIPLTWTTGLAGFFLFRIFDIIKPPPARQLERKLKGGWGVVMDDVAAGVMAHLVLRVVLMVTAKLWPLT
jgi:phosphatidylglycerophosphatase A